MELRWLKGNWSFGNFKLQYLKDPMHGHWEDVPVVTKSAKPSLADIFKEEIDKVRILDLEFVGRLAQIAENHILGGGKV